MIFVVTIKSVYNVMDSGKRVAAYVGLSTDSKPTDCANGSEFAEIDTGKAYLYDEDGSTWEEQTVEEQTVEEQS